jgi:hypothetical protein
VCYELQKANALHFESFADTDACFLYASYKKVEERQLTVVPISAYLNSASQCASLCENDDFCDSYKFCNKISSKMCAAM